jgi:galactoside O-acetyltransferase
MEYVPQAIVIKRGVRIGANVTILGGVEVGENAVIGAGSVVTKDIPPGRIAYGSPARVRGVVAKEEWL